MDLGYVILLLKYVFFGFRVDKFTFRVLRFSLGVIFGKVENLEK